jgi:hypothetical protein
MVLTKLGDIIREHEFNKKINHHRFIVYNSLIIFNNSRITN